MTSSHGQRDQSYRCCNAAYSAQTFPWPWLFITSYHTPKSDVPSGAIKQAKVQQRARNIAKFRAVQARKLLYGAFVTVLLKIKAKTGGHGIY
jgi:hypothetical protein